MPPRQVCRYHRWRHLLMMRFTATSTPSTAATTGKFTYVETFHDNYQKRLLATEFDHELVHRVAVHPLEYVNGDDVTTHRADPAGHQAQCARAIGQGDTNEISGHGAEIRRSM